MIAKKETIREPQALAQMIEYFDINIMQATPTLWHALVTNEPEKLRGLECLSEARRRRAVFTGAS